MDTIRDDKFSNITARIESKFMTQLHNTPNHPIEIIKKKIYNYFGDKFNKFDDLSPVVSVTDNFDLLRIPTDHPSRQKTDTYYLNKDTVLRTHTSAHQNELLSKGERQFLVSGNVFRNDEIDRNHYPIFHQMEGVCIVDDDIDSKQDLLDTLSGLVEYLFPNCKFRINNDYFPFTEPSFEIEVEFNGKWLEVLGCGVIHREILDHHKIVQNGWAFGLGLERLAMILFDISDIRYFWSRDSKFLDQFKSGEIVKFKPYSELPTRSDDIAIWIPDDQLIDDKNNKIWIKENIFFETIREIAGDMVESVTLFDTFTHPKNKKYSRAYRITYSPIDPSLKDPAIFTKLALNYHKLISDTLFTRCGTVQH
jgi:phenylalanyl-tRNA synthetase alpha chain